MKYLKSVICFPIILISCQTVTSSKDEQKSNNTENIIKTFKPIFNGVWVESGYIEAISKSKSPNKSGKALAPMVELHIDITKISGDSLFIEAPGIHEGGGFTVYFRSGTKETSLPTSISDYNREINFYELGYEIANNDTVLVIYHFDNTKKLLNEMKYIKTVESSESALQYMVNKTLFSGIYNATDENGNKIKVRFTNNGFVNGLPGYTNYHVVTDFVAEPENKSDEICFDIQTKNQACFTYTIINDTINLYKAAGKEESINPVFLKYRLLKYKLVKE